MSSAAGLDLESEPKMHGSNLRTHHILTQAAYTLVHGL